MNLWFGAGGYVLIRSSIHTIQEKIISFLLLFCSRPTACHTYKQVTINADPIQPINTTTL
jgi:hypothetical protein